jgi:hypothetical protein
VRHEAVGARACPWVAPVRGKRYGYSMSLAEIKSAVAELSNQERAELTAWLLSLDREAWDREIEADFSPGGAGMKLLDNVDAAIDRGEFKPLE